MPREEVKPLRPRRRTALAIAILVLFSGAAFGFGWRHYRLSTEIARENDALIRSLVQSTLTAEKDVAQVRLALFDVGSAQGSAEEQLKAILEVEPTIVCQTVSAADIQSGILKGFDVVLFPGGFAPEQHALLDDKGRLRVKEFVRGGGGYVGICAGAYLATAKYNFGLELVNAKAVTGRIDVGDRMISAADRGGGMVKMELTEAGSSLFRGPTGTFDVFYYTGPVLSPAGIELPTYVTLGTFRSEVWKHESQQGQMIDTPAIIAGSFGKGRVILFSPHTEVTKGFEFLVRRSVLATRRTGSEN
jgi:putative intracellular protease/amidase